MTKTTSIILILLYIISFMTVFLSGKIVGFENILQIMTKENGFFETLSVVFLLGIFFFGINFVITNRIENKFIKLLIIFFTVLTFIAAMEEMSWGQHLFHFESLHFFELHNQQKETNLHNFVDGNIFSSIIYFTVYTFFIFIPLLIHFLQKRINILRNFSTFTPSLHMILIVLYASTFQIYFYNDIGVIIDFITLCIGFFLFIFVVSRNKLWTKYLLIHFIFIIISMGIFMSEYRIFSFFNMQYEIREMFVIFAIFVFSIEFTKNLKNNESIITKSY